jgi:MOSC domain-containing protein YiiM
MGVVVSINTSRGGVPKRAMFEAFVSETGVSGDMQADPRYHGGPDRAVVLFSSDVIAALRREGHPIAPGSTGENLTLAGLDWPTITPGKRLRIGGATIEITKYATPCAKIRDSFARRQYTRIAQAEHPGWSRVCARVLESGLVAPGDNVELVGLTR